MNEYNKYIKDVLSGKIITSKYIRQQVERLEKFKKRDDMYFDEKAVQDCFDFCAAMKEWSGKAAGKSGALLPFQKWIVGSILGIKWKKDGTRVCRNSFTLVSRKNAKTSLIAKLCSYLLLCDGEANPFIGCVATSAQNARILFEAAQEYLKTIDPDKRIIKHYRNYMKVPQNNGEFHVFSSQAETLEGYNFLGAAIDEVHTYTDNKLISVIQASQGARKNPIIFQISTCGSLLDGYPCYETYKMSIEILNGLKTDDSFFPFIYMMDGDDDWRDEKNWIKSNPSLDVIVTRDYIRQQMNLALNDSTQMPLFKTKTLNMWVNSFNTWIDTSIIAGLMKPVDLENYRGKSVIASVDLSTVSDFSALSILIPPDKDTDDKYIFKNYTFLPEETIKNHPNQLLYKSFIEEGSMIVTNGNVCDYDYILNKIYEINQICPISAIYLDKWNATMFQIAATEAGFQVFEFSQSVGNFNSCTKEVERLIKEGKMIIDKSRNTLFQFSNAVLKGDINGNVKVTKESNYKKVDTVIAMCQAVGGYMKNPVPNDFDIFVI